MPRRARPAGKARPLLGPTCAPELASIGLETVEDLRELGWEEACIRWVEAFPLRLNVNAFYGVIAAVEGVDWRELDEGWKRRARALRDRLAQEQL
ncbi:MAG: TfoX/Sxy family DNA transformation protein [Anaeromyxobacter sp.]